METYCVVWNGEIQKRRRDEQTRPAPPIVETDGRTRNGRFMQPGNFHDLCDLTIQRILRHANITTTRKSYIEIREDNMTAGMAQLESEIRRTETVQ